MVQYQPDVIYVLVIMIIDYYFDIVGQNIFHLITCWLPHTCNELYCYQIGYMSTYLCMYVSVCFCILILHIFCFSQTCIDPYSVALFQRCKAFLLYPIVVFLRAQQKQAFTCKSLGMINQSCNIISIVMTGWYKRKYFGDGWK